MSDIVQRLRARAENDSEVYRYQGGGMLCNLAADYIEVLEKNLRLIALNDEYPEDEPRSYRPQWTSGQCAMIAKSALKDAHKLSDQEKVK